MSEKFESELVRTKEMSERVISRESKKGDNIIIEFHVLDTSGEYSYTKEIIFRTPKGEEIRFSEFCPSSWKFSSYEEIEKRRAKLGVRVYGEPKVMCDRGRKEIRYDDLKRDGRFLALLHEIGHAHQQTRDILHEYTHNENIEVRYKNRDLTLTDIRARGEDPNDYIWITVYDDHGKGTGGLDNDETWFEMLAPRRLIQQYAKDRAKEERDAWAFALKQLRKLKEKGIVLEENLKDINKVRSEIYSCLESYAKTFKRIYKCGDDYFTKGREFVKKKIDDFISKG